MLQKIVLAIAIFLLALIALSLGESMLSPVLASIQTLAQTFSFNVSHVWRFVLSYVQSHWIHVILAGLITLALSLWLHLSDPQRFSQPGSHRKIAMVLAVLLGWLGAHRFYRGQIGLGLVYLFIGIFYPWPIVLISLIDALRYAFMSEQDFSIKP